MRQTKKIIFSTFLVVLLAIQATLFLTPQSASAAPSNNYCDGKYSDPAIANACRAGYDRGVNNFKDCSGVYTTPTSDFRKACDDGFNGGKASQQPQAQPQQQGQTQPQQQAQSTPAAQAQSTNETTCAVDKVGWIVCPIMESAAKASDNLFKFLADNFLSVDVVLLDDNSGTKTAWESARNLANVAFVIVFVIIIISQVTGAGMKNYGIKRMLPRLIIAAIAVNLSFYICQAMADISNILGYNIQLFLKEAAISTGGPLPFDNPPNSQTGDGILGKVTLAALGLAVAIWLYLALMSGTIVLVLVTCLVIVIILLMRKAFIVLLVVVSPLAFVAYLLPNTEKYFDKWLGMFWKLLLVFPIVALLLGGGQLASAIILSAATSSQQEVVADPNCNPEDPAQKERAGGYRTPCEGTVKVGQNNKDVGWTMALIAAGVSVAPLLAVWGVLQGALSAAEAIGAKVASGVQRGGRSAGGWGASKVKGGGDLVKKRVGENAQGMWQRSQARGLEDGATGLDRLAGGVARRRGRRAERLNLSKSALERAQRETIDRDIAEGGAGITDGLTAGAAGRAQRGAQANRDKVQAEELQAASLTARDLSVGDLRAVVAGAINNEEQVNDPRVAAAVQELAKRQDFEGLEAAINKFGTNDHGRDAAGNPTSQANLVTRTLASSISQNNPGFFTAGNIGDMSRGAMGGTTYGSMVGKNISDGVFSAEKMAEAGRSTLEEASYVANSVGGTAHTTLTAAANQLVGDSRLRAKLSRNGDIVNDIRSGVQRTSR